MSHVVYSLVCFGCYSWRDFLYPDTNGNNAWQGVHSHELFENNLIPTWFGKLKVLEQEKAVIVQIANAALARRSRPLTRERFEIIKQNLERIEGAVAQV